MVALTVELVNGGTKLQSTGQVYYTWDIRAYLFVLGLVFLLIYYKRYCCCIERSSEEREVVRNCLYSNFSPTEKMETKRFSQPCQSLKETTISQIWCLIK